jgi:hypothetical protein
MMPDRKKAEIQACSSWASGESMLQSLVMLGQVV